MEEPKEEQTEELETYELTEAKMEKLTEELKEMALTLGAFKVGIATTGTLAGGPPSTDLTYVLPEAKSAIVFALAFDQDLIEPYFRKLDHKSLDTNKVRTTTLANGIALEMAGFLQQYGYKAVPQLQISFIVGIRKTGCLICIPLFRIGIWRSALG